MLIPLVTSLIHFFRIGVVQVSKEPARCAPWWSSTRTSCSPLSRLTMSWPCSGTTSRASHSSLWRRWWISRKPQRQRCLPWPPSPLASSSTSRMLRWWRASSESDCFLFFFVDVGHGSNEFFCNIRWRRVCEWLQVWPLSYWSKWVAVCWDSFAWKLLFLVLFL